MLLDPDYSQIYVEDCEVCCNPIEIKTSFFEGEMSGFEALKIGQ